MTALFFAGSQLSKTCSQPTTPFVGKTLPSIKASRISPPRSERDPTPFRSLAAAHPIVSSALNMHSNAEISGALSLPISNCSTPWTRFLISALASIVRLTTTYLTLEFVISGYLPSCCSA
ncbi:hypothetical protein CPB85DRAFT_1343545, partial [Mucidula mucida]